VTLPAFGTLGIAWHHHVQGGMVGRVLFNSKQRFYELSTVPRYDSCAVTNGKAPASSHGEPLPILVVDEQRQKKRTRYGYGLTEEMAQQPSHHIHVYWQPLSANGH
jgi:hypothetical protein